MTCPDCQAHPARLCPFHALTSNHDDPVDFEMMVLDLRAELAQEREEKERLRKAVAKAATALMLALSERP